MNGDLTSCTISELHKLISTKKICVSDIAQAYLERIKSLDPFLGAYLSVNNDAISTAKMLDSKGNGTSSSSLFGVPLAVKDNICVEGLSTTCGSEILENYVAPYDASVIKKLKHCGSVFLGKTNMDEFAMGSSCENSAFGPTKNPWDTDRVPGGSSGGSAAAVASGLCAAALGSDTGGSIRQPSSFCGVVGLKPTYGRLSRFGLVAFASSMDHIGLICKDVTDCSLLFDAVAFHDSLDSTSLSAPEPNTHLELAKGFKGIRIGLPKEYFEEGIDEDILLRINEAVKIMEKSGAILQEVSLPFTKYGIADYYLVATAEASSNLARFDGIRYGKRIDNETGLASLYSDTRGQLLGREVKRRIMLGTFALSSGYYDAYYLKASKVRRLIHEDFERVFSQVDVIAGPTTPNKPFKFGGKRVDPIQMYLCDVLTVCVNLAGIPSLSIPCGLTSERLPVGIQITSKHLNEGMIFRVAKSLENEIDFKNIRKAELDKKWWNLKQ